MTKQPVWVIMPVRAHRAYTIAAISDVLGQTTPVSLLVVNQGVDDDFREELERTAEHSGSGLLQPGYEVMLWSHQPPLPSLGGTWNRALDCAWEAGAEVALVVNNDVRLHRDTVITLRTILEEAGALCVSAVGVTEGQFYPESEISTLADTPRGGPDFSCFLISEACHQRFRFDEGFVPAFCEDLDYHRRLMLAGEGNRIFSVNLPYLHYASATLRSLDPVEADRVRSQIERVSRAYYAKKWGGPVNQETRWTAFGLVLQEDRPDPAMQALVDQPTTPKLQAYVQQHRVAPFLTEAAAMDTLLDEANDAR